MTSLSSFAIITICLIMNNVFKNYIDKPYRYVYQNGPDIITSKDQAFKEGLNCIALMHLLLKDIFKLELPSNVKGWEIFCDNPYFESIKSKEDLQTGDILFFGRKE